MMQMQFQVQYLLQASMIVAYVVCLVRRLLSLGKHCNVHEKLSAAVKIAI